MICFELKILVKHHKLYQYILLKQKQKQQLQLFVLFGELTGSKYLNNNLNRAGEVILCCIATAIITARSSRPQRLHCNSVYHIHSNSIHDNTH